MPARQILTEWARIGGTKVVGGEKMTGAPLTLKLVNVPERQALDIILRNVAGYHGGAAAGVGHAGRVRLTTASSSSPTSAVAPHARGATPRGWRTPAGGGVNGGMMA